jgi:hypothetical protein
MLDGLVFHPLDFLILFFTSHIISFFFNFQIYLHLRFGPDTMVSLLTKILSTIERVQSFSQGSWLKVTPWYLDRTEDRLTILIKEHPKQICASKRILAVQMRTRTWWAHFLLPKFSHFVLYIPYYFIFSIFRFTSIFGSVRIPWCHFWPRSWPPSSEFDLSANAYGNFSTMSPEADFKSSTNQFAKT